MTNLSLKSKSMFNEKGLFTLLSILGLIVIYFLSSVIIPVALSALVAFFMYPLVKRVTKYIPYNAAVILISSIFIIAIIILLAAVIPAAIKQLGELFNTLGHLTEKYSKFLSENKNSYNLFGVEVNVLEWFEKIKTNILTNSSSMAEQAFALVNNIISLITYCIIVPILAVMILLDKKVLDNYVDELSRKSSKFSKNVLRDFNQNVSSYMYAKTVETIILSVATYLLLALYGIPYTLILSILSGLSVFIPFVGFILATVPLVFVAGYAIGFNFSLVIFFILYMILQSADDYILSPYLTSKAINIPSSVVMISMIFGGYFSGVMGLFLAVPICIYLKAIYDNW